MLLIVLSDFSSFEIESFVLRVSHGKSLSRKRTVKHDCFEQFVFCGSRKQKSYVFGIFAESFDLFVTVNVIDGSRFFFQILVKECLQRADREI